MSHNVHGLINLVDDAKYHCQPFDMIICFRFEIPSNLFYNWLENMKNLCLRLAGGYNKF